jgi:two-component system chemotaxis sensor kinase CheA
MKDEAIVAEFKIESEEQLGGIENHLIGLENQPDHRDEFINAAFRAMHSIKGGASFLGFHKLSKLAHNMESVLNKFRDGTLHPSHEAISALLKGLDRIREMFADLESSNHAGIDRELALLQSLKQKSGQESSEEVPDGLKLISVRSDSEGETIGEPIYPDLHIQSPPPADEALILAKFDLLQLAEMAELESLIQIWERITANTTLYGYRLDSKADKLRRNLPFQPIVMTCLTAPFTDDFPAQEFALEWQQVRIEAEPEVQQPPAAEPPSEPKKPAKDDEAFVHVSLKLLDRIIALTGELALHRYRLARSVPQNSYLHTLSRSIDRVTGQLQEAVVATRLNSFENLFARMQRVVRDLSVKLSKPLELRVEGGDQQVDRQLLQRLGESLAHLIRNACDHGIETVERRQELGKPQAGQIVLQVQRHGELVIVEVSDDGRGLDLERIRSRAVQLKKVTKEEAEGLTKQELLQLVLSPGFSTAKKVDAISGRGVGLDVVRQNVEEMGGSFEIRTKADEGSRFVMTLPAHVSITSVLLCQIQGKSYGIARNFVKKLVTLYDRDILKQVQITDNGAIIQYQGTPLPLIPLRDVIAEVQPFDRQRRQQSARNMLAEPRDALNHDPESPQSLHFVVLQVGELRFALVVEKLRGVSDLLVEAMHPCLNPIAIFSGSISLEDGSLALQLDLMGLARHYGVTRAMFEQPLLEQAYSNWQNAREILLFKSPAGRFEALPMQVVQRVIPISRIDLMLKEDLHFAAIDHQHTYLLETDFELVRPLPKQERWYAVQLKGMVNPTAILASQMLVSQRHHEGFVPDPLPGLDLGSLQIEHTHFTVPNPFALERSIPPSWLPVVARAKPIFLLLWDRDPLHIHWQKAMLALLGYQIVVWDEVKATWDEDFLIGLYVEELPASEETFQRWEQVCKAHQLPTLALGPTKIHRWSLTELGQVLTALEAAI